MSRPVGHRARPVRWLSQDELGHFMAQVRRASARDGLMMSLLYYCALRVSQVVGLRLTDLDVPARQITVRGSKDGTAVTYDLPSELWLEARRWLRIRPKRSEWLFPSRVHPSHHLSATSARLVFKALAAKAGLTGHTSADLRHARSAPPLKKPL